jgi:hypothetical protein
MEDSSPVCMPSMLDFGSFWQFSAWHWQPAPD